MKTVTCFLFWHSLEFEVDKLLPDKTSDHDFAAGYFNLN